MPQFDSELVQLMRTVLEGAMTRVPLEISGSTTKAYLAEVILKAAAQGQTSYSDLIAAATAQIHTLTSILTCRSPRTAPDSLQGPSSLCPQGSPSPIPVTSGAQAPVVFRPPPGHFSLPLVYGRALSPQIGGQLILGGRLGSSGSFGDVDAQRRVMAEQLLTGLQR